MVKLSKSRKEFIRTVAEASKQSVLQITNNNIDLLKEELETTLYREKLRIKQNPWAVDPDDEQDFWRKVKSNLVQLSQDGSLNKTQKKKKYIEILDEITTRYAEEIASNFIHSHYKLTRRMVTYGFSLNS